MGQIQNRRKKRGTLRREKMDGARVVERGSNLSRMGRGTKVRRNHDPNVRESKKKTNSGLVSTAGHELDKGR